METEENIENAKYNVSDLHGDAHGVAEVDDDEGDGDQPLLPGEVDSPGHFERLWGLEMSLENWLYFCCCRCLCWFKEKTFFFFYDLSILLKTLVFDFKLK
jgi:hypothetical protein